MASGAPQYFIADTPEVQAAKAQFAAAWNASNIRNQGAPVHQAPGSAQDKIPKTRPSEQPFPKNRKGRTITFGSANSAINNSGNAGIKTYLRG